MTTTPIHTQHPTRLVIVSGMAGSGKSVALHALEDTGYYCVDNLPPSLLLPLFDDIQAAPAPSTHIAVSIDVRSAHNLNHIAQYMQNLQQRGIEVIKLFLDTSDPILMRRFSETRRKHPLTQSNNQKQAHDLQAAIAMERQLLAPMREEAIVLDTAMTRPAQLRSQIKELLAIKTEHLTLSIESFAFKRGIPTDADYVFDVRMLPNPYYELELRPLTGRDAPVAEFLQKQPEVASMYQHISDFFTHWLPELANNHRSYVSIAIGCTGGQHRSVYLVERLYQALAQDWTCIKRHRELELAQTRK